MKRLDGSRFGLSPNERGVPVSFYKDFASTQSLEVLKVVYFAFGPLNYLTKIVRLPCKTKVQLDMLFSRLFKNNNKYMRTKFIDKISPNSAGIVLRKKI
jgi:hypothetical protein